MCAGLLQAAIFRKLAGQAHELKLIQEALILLEREKQQQDIRDAKTREESLKKLTGCLNDISGHLSQSMSESDVSERRNDEKRKFVKNKIEELRIREELQREFEGKMRSFVEEKEKELQDIFQKASQDKHREVEEELKNVMQENERLKMRLKVEQFQVRLSGYLTWQQVLNFHVRAESDVAAKPFEVRSSEIRSIPRVATSSREWRKKLYGRLLNDSEYPISVDASMSNVIT
eukprot:767785-Hanusia_phi.AAC.9